MKNALNRLRFWAFFAFYTEGVNVSWYCFTELFINWNECIFYLKTVKNGETFGELLKFPERNVPHSSKRVYFLFKNGKKRLNVRGTFKVPRT